MRRMVVLFVAIALATAGLGCTRSAEPARTEQPVILTFVNTVPVPAIDPALVTDEAGYIAVVNLYDPLLFPAVEEGLMDPAPHLATEWTVSADGRVYRFTLREGVKFHSGRELTAEDVVFSMDRVLSLKKGPAWMWLPVLSPGSTRAVDPYTVEFHLKEPYAPFLATLIHLFVVDAELIRANLGAGDFGDLGDYGQGFLSANDAGSGPYVLEKWDREGDLVANRFADYWKGWRQGQVDRFVYRTVREEATVKMLIKGGEADLVGQWLSVETYNELAATPGLKVAEDPTVQLFHLPMNTAKPPLDCIYFRLALVHALDYTTANTEIFPGAVQARGPVPIKAAGHNSDLAPFRYDMAKAREYLAKSKYRPGEYVIQYHFTDVIPAQRKLGLLLQSSLAELGIKMEINPTPWVRLTELCAKPETTPHIGAFYYTLRYPHPHSHTFAMYHPSAHGSWIAMSWYNNPGVTRVLEEAVKEVDTERQMQLYKQAQAMIAGDAPSIYVNNPVHRIAHAEYVKGYRYVGLIGYDLAVYYLTVDKQ